jgi:hypothetical protein
MNEQPQLPPQPLPPQNLPPELPKQQPFTPQLPVESQYTPSDVDTKIAEQQQLAAGLSRLGLETELPQSASFWQRLATSLLIVLPILLVSGITIASVVGHNHKQALLAKYKATQQAAQAENPTNDEGSKLNRVSNSPTTTDTSTTSNGTADKTSNQSNTNVTSKTTATAPVVAKPVVVTPSKPTPTPTPAPTPTPTPAPNVKVSKVLVIIEENHSLTQMLAGMPYAFSLARQYGYATDYVTTVTSKGAAVHPSLPNYIALASGSYQNITDDKDPSSHKLAGTSVFGQAIKAGKTAKTYAEGMTSNCKTTSTGKYAVRHNPWAYFVNERTACQQYDVPLTKFAGDVTAGTLPNVGFLIPDVCNDAHDCSLGGADTFFKSYMAKVFAGPDWKSGNLVVILTADEDDKKNGNKVLTVVIHPSIHSKVVSSHLTHYSLTRLYAEVTHTSPLLAGATAPSLSAAFGLQVQ